MPMPHSSPTLVLVAALFLLAQAADAPPVLAPYRFDPPPERLDPAERQRLDSYNMEVDQRLRALELQLQLQQGQLDAQGLRTLQQHRLEAERLNQLRQQN